MYEVKRRDESKGKLIPLNLFSVYQDRSDLMMFDYAEPYSVSTFGV